MTPNGAVLFVVILIVAAMLADLPGLVVICAVAAAFAVLETRENAWSALRRAALLVLPLAAFMLAIWVGLIGKSPLEIESGLPGSRTSALLYVATVSLRLFLIVFVLQAVLLCFADESPFSVIRSLRAPLGVKRLLVLTLSLIETLRHAVGRSHMALVASGVITRRLSLRNLGHGWILIQSVWLTAITTVLGRLRDKWPAENTLALLEPALAQQERPMCARDRVWHLVALAAALFVFGRLILGTA
ncbi:MAG TPA: hypothetical protein VM867_05780 [Xanthobacteraceae bacterium]|jgi:hypothetical protein|nr:hypothetical protein [Xanthobacteraceae bacterium]